MLQLFLFVVFSCMFPKLDDVETEMYTVICLDSSNPNS